MLIVDTGPLVSIADRDDPHYQRCRDLLEGEPGQLVTTALVVAEAGYLINRNLGPAAETALLDMICDGSLLVEDLRPVDWARIRELSVTYADLPLGVTDASVIAIAERHRAGRVATLDSRHFRVVRPATGKSFELVP